jgi:hypothetical protein
MHGSALFHTQRRGTTDSMDSVYHIAGTKARLRVTDKLVLYAHALLRILPGICDNQRIKNGRIEY